MATVRLEGLDQLKKFHLIGTRTRDLPACSIVPEQTTLSRAPKSVVPMLFYSEAPLMLMKMSEARQLIKIT
jgi:hypothetical protein